MSTPDPNGPLKLACAYCTFTTPLPDDMVLHMFTTGHGVAPGLREKMTDGGLFAELTSVLSRVQADPGCGTPVDENDLTDEDRAVLDRLAKAEKEKKMP